MNLVVIPAPDRKTARGDSGSSPGSTHVLHRTTPPREEHPGAPRPGVPSPPRVKRQRGKSGFRGKTFFFPFFSTAEMSSPKDLVPPDAPSSERASRASGPAGDPGLRSRDERMSSREICKYFLHGACRNGASCRFSHEMSAPKSTVCTYYLAGNCAYGDKCRYDHVRPKVRASIERHARSNTVRGMARLPPPYPRRLPDRARDLAPATTSPTFPLGSSAHPRLSDPLFRVFRHRRLFVAFFLRAFADAQTRPRTIRRTPAPRADPPAAPRSRALRARPARPP